MDKIIAPYRIEPPDLKDKPDIIGIDWFKWLLDFPGKKKKVTSTLTKWENGLKARIGIKGSPELVHYTCSEKLGRKVLLMRSDGLAYQMTPETDSKMPGNLKV